MLVGCEDARRLHGSSPFRTQQALDLDAALKTEGLAVVADPVNFRNLIDTVTLLVDRDTAFTTEDNQVLVLIVTIVAYRTLCILLHYKASFMRTK